MVFILHLTRYYFKLFLSKIGIFCKNILILGSGNAGKMVAKGLIDDKEFGFRIAGFLDDNKAGDCMKWINKNY
ncbi:hypothetical protein FHQ18_07855 [Deferribacter autotrophicus]|uniref:PglD N-terminal domain-containing protein n=2 Tax=Deferribacter autotrophicus TaxID=500465 RepID=A0A5A8F0Q4_9BACT|nr:hypothetical protein FHQ18_07855 [Deferribacter autotrophicus]